jgi:hypothetical protein
MSLFNGVLGAKRLEILNELVPAATVMAYLATSPSAKTEVEEVRAAASAQGIQLLVLNASTEEELDAAFANLVKLRAGGLASLGSRSSTVSATDLWRYPHDMRFLRATVFWNTLWLAD